MKSAVLVFPGINRERDMARALRLISGREPAMVWHEPRQALRRVPTCRGAGGFSYGDYLRCGRDRRASPVMRRWQVRREGGLELGVCNGFQNPVRVRLLRASQCATPG